MDNKEPLLQVKQLSTGYGAIQVLWDIDIDVYEKEAVCIIGSNGAGKSTLMQTLIGAHPLWGGNIHYEGNDITNTRNSERVKRRIAIVPEGRQLFPALTIEDNLLLGAYLRKDSAAVKESLASVYDTFPVIKKYRKRLAGGLSGGEQQMCAVGRALMTEPNLMLIDELSLGLAPVIVEQLTELLQRIRKERSLSILLVEQDVEVALEITDRGYVLETGRVVLADTSKELAVNKHIHSAYLGL